MDNTAESIYKQAKTAMKELSQLGTTIEEAKVIAWRTKYDQLWLDIDESPGVNFSTISDRKYSVIDKFYETVNEFDIMISIRSNPSENGIYIIWSVVSPSDDINELTKQCQEALDDFDTFEIIQTLPNTAYTDWLYRYNQVFKHIQTVEKQMNLNIFMKRFMDKYKHQYDYFFALYNNDEFCHKQIFSE